jgi:hypothetical protein
MSAKLFLARHGIIRDHIVRADPSHQDMYEVRSLWDKGKNACLFKEQCLTCGDTGMADAMIARL